MVNFKYFWQLPQHLLALLIIFFFNIKIIKTETYKHTKVYWVNQSSWGVSLGNYILLDNNYNQTTVMHEYGHSIQSLYTGPFYLLLIGLPSITMNILTRLRILKAENYYKRWPENSADRLGNVKRNHI